MSAYSVDSDAVLTATAAMRGTIARVQSENQAMLAQLTQLQSSWTGGASAAFQGVVDQWRAAQHQVDDAILAVSAALGAAGRQYADAELASASLFR
ncbi:WXG100 family type VII secretion target [Microbacterium fluvii]|uniref:ESAT-6-like protein n=1 Tax=Microbacterium fluvii TaxID=415215 RepID=A0ABW2HEI5_9MICO|nr:WXG100 family type VII secretion target [Microbacterium fluvii]MCU4671776.1 WXG100 family type VII secretion target [Microbacterium fluvii]